MHKPLNHRGKPGGGVIMCAWPVLTSRFPSDQRCGAYPGAKNPGADAQWHLLHESGFGAAFLRSRFSKLVDLSRL